MSLPRGGTYTFFAAYQFFYFLLSIYDNLIVNTTYLIIVDNCRQTENK